MTESDKSTAAIERKLLKNSSNWAHSVVTSLIELQARTKVIGSLIQKYDINITEADIGRMFKNRHGFASPRGLDSHNPERMVDSFEKALHSSVYLGLFRQYEKLHEQKVSAYIDSYRAYLSMFSLTVGNAPLSFSIAHRIAVYVDTGLLDYSRCSKCKLKYVQISCCGKASCPACQIIARSQKPQLRVVSDRKVGT